MKVKTAPAPIANLRIGDVGSQRVVKSQKKDGPEISGSVVRADDDEPVPRNAQSGAERTRLYRDRLRARVRCLPVPLAQATTERVIDLLSDAGDLNESDAGDDRIVGRVLGAWLDKNLGRLSKKV